MRRFFILQIYKISFPIPLAQKISSITHTDIWAARDWQLQMANGAAESGVVIQYCMALPREIMQSVESNVNARARTSSDYQLGL